MPNHPLLPPVVSQAVSSWSAATPIFTGPWVIAPRSADAFVQSTAR
ncbi:hypothetical protein [Yimella lutea]|nr:hypothetical protein [Yimella lutea]